VNISTVETPRVIRRVHHGNAANRPMIACNLGSIEAHLGVIRTAPASASEWRSTARACRGRSRQKPPKFLEP
jgi:hypothetical protein